MHVLTALPCQGPALQADPAQPMVLIQVLLHIFKGTPSLGRNCSLKLEFALFLWLLFKELNDVEISVSQVAF